MFDVQIKRIHEYKRQLLNILETVARYNAIRANPTLDFAPRVKIFAGKAAASYTAGQADHQAGHRRRPRGQRRPDRARPAQGGVPAQLQRVSLAETIIPAVDLSEQISTAGMEASGTGNMKMALNGALTIGTLDGANVELRDLVGADNIFIFGLTAAEVEAAPRAAASTRPPASPPRPRCARRSTRSPPACSPPTTRDATAASSTRSPTTTISWSAPISTPTGRRSAKVDEAWRDREPVDAVEHHQHRQCRLVLVRPDDIANMRKKSGTRRSRPLG